jgi:hypothetical protein
MADNTRTRSGSLLKNGALATLVSVLLNCALQVGAVALFEIPAEFPPLQGPGPVIFFSVIGAVAGVGVFAGMAGVSARPVSVFRVVAGGGAIFPGAAPAGVGTLMLMHVVSAAVVVWAVERSS